MAESTTKTIYRCLSLGAGVQSSVLALLLSQQDPRLVELGYPKPDIAVFADTGWEPDYVIPIWSGSKVSWIIHLSVCRLATFGRISSWAVLSPAIALWMCHSTWFMEMARREC